jgi:hypothetical protein
VTTSVGGGEVTVSTTGDAGDVEQLRQIVTQLGDQVGLTQEVQDCFEREFAQIPDEELQKYVDLLQTLPLEQVQEQMVPLTNRINRACIPNNGPTIDEHADANQVALIRETTKRQLGALLRRQNVPEPMIACVLGKFDALSDAEVIEASNESVKDARARFLGFVRECR